jgi:hydrogenase nickel incorporation protein HypA/HybF
MHEYSVVQALVDRVEQEAASRNATRVDRLHVRIGELSGVDAGLLTTAYLTYRVRTICEGAPLDVVHVPAEWACRACGTTVPRGQALRCRACGGPASLRQGDEIMLDRIEMEVP